jgi:hypothetical protein
MWATVGAASNHKGPFHLALCRLSHIGNNFPRVNVQTIARGR